MLFQLVPTKFLKSELFSCLPKVGHVIKSYKEPIGVRNPSSTDKKSGIQYVESRIHIVESKIEDFLGLTYRIYSINRPGRLLNFHHFQQVK